MSEHTTLRVFRGYICCEVAATSERQADEITQSVASLINHDARVLLAWRTEIGVGALLERIAAYDRLVTAAIDAELGNADDLRQFLRAGLEECRQ